MGKFLWSVLGIFSIIRLRIRGVKISGMTYIVRKHFRVVGDAEKIEIDGRYGGGYIGPDSMMTCSGSGEIKIGFGFRATEHLRLTSLNRVVIGDNVLLGSSVTILDCNHGMNAEEEGYFEQKMLLKEVHIDDGVWCGDYVVILPGVTVGKHSIIGAGSIVTKSVPSYCIAVGNPARVIKKWDFDSKSWKKVEADA
ncbi:MAG: acyltransferase [Roseburia sp.]